MLLVQQALSEADNNVMEERKLRDEGVSREGDLSDRLNQLTLAHSQLVELLQSRQAEHEVSASSHTPNCHVTRPGPRLSSSVRKRR